MKSLIPLTGAKYKDQCRVEDKIPIYLIVGGAVGVTVGTLIKSKYFCRNITNQQKFRQNGNGKLFKLGR